MKFQTLNYKRKNGGKLSQRQNIQASKRQRQNVSAPARIGVAKTSRRQNFGANRRRQNGAGTCFFSEDSQKHSKACFFLSYVWLVLLFHTVSYRFNWSAGIKMKVETQAYRRCAPQLIWYLSVLLLFSFSVSSIYPSLQVSVSHTTLDISTRCLSPS